MNRAARVAVLALSAAAAMVAACGPTVSTRPPAAAAGDPAAGLDKLQERGCASCHLVPGAPGSEAYVGPPLVAWSRRSYIAGTLPNTQPNLERWITDPQSVRPGSAMPDLGVSAIDARDIAAYLLTLEP